jgi:phage tail-like protein
VSAPGQPPSPLHVFGFQLVFHDANPTSADVDVPMALPQAGFSECTGLEGTMEPKVIKEGGRNYGVVQLPGPVTFATVILKRGMFTNDTFLFDWFQKATITQYGYRLNVSITLRKPDGSKAFTWQLSRAVPVKLKIADLNAKATEVGVEELHLAHEGLTLVA